MIRFQLLECEYFLVSLVLCDSKLKIIGLRMSSLALGNTVTFFHLIYYFFGL